MSMTCAKSGDWSLVVQFCNLFSMCRLVMLQFKKLMQYTCKELN